MIVAIDTWAVELSISVAVILVELIELLLLIQKVSLGIFVAVQIVVSKAEDGNHCRNNDRQYNIMARGIKVSKNWITFGTDIWHATVMLILAAKVGRNWQ